MDGLAAVSARVQQIQGLVQSMQGVTRPGLGAAATLAGDRTGSGAPGAPGAASFEATLDRARAAGAARPGGGVDADGVPLDLKRFGNGTVPSDALTGIGVGRHRLWEPAADSFRSLLAAADKAGVRIGVTDSYRSYDAQVDVARRKGLYSDGGLAAVPGTSDHGWGLSVDLDLDGRAQAWMRENAGRFGFAEDVPREPWHWTFQP